jgi:hypothetical protein
MERRVVETRKKRYCGIKLTWRRIVDENGKRQESLELTDEDFLRLVADSVALSRLKAERSGNV